MDKLKTTDSLTSDNTDFIEQAEYYMKMLTGALAVLSSTDPAELSKDDFHDYCLIPFGSSLTFIPLT